MNQLYTLDEQALLDAGWRQPEQAGFASRFGPLWTRIEDGARAFGVLATADHLNPARSVHGGMLAALIDHALSAIAWEALDHTPCVTIQLDSKFIRGAGAGDFLEARGRIVQATRSLVFLEGAVSHGAHTLLQASAILKILR